MAQRQRQGQVARKKRSLREEPEFQHLYTTLMAGRASERMDLLEFIGKLRQCIPAPLRSVQIGLNHVEAWARERDERLHGG